jgi:hypothetical protein
MQPMLPREKPVYSAGGAHRQSTLGVRPWQEQRAILVGDKRREHATPCLEKPARRAMPAGPGGQ